MTSSSDIHRKSEGLVEVVGGGVNNGKTLKASAPLSLRHFEETWEDLKGSVCIYCITPHIDFEE